MTKACSVGLRLGPSPAKSGACPTKGFHFHTGRALAAKLGYGEEVDGLPDAVVESFAGVGNPFAVGSLEPGSSVLDLGSGAGLDAVLAAKQVGPSGRVIGVDMTVPMPEKARDNAGRVGLANLEFREGRAETCRWPMPR